MPEESVQISISAVSSMIVFVVILFFIAVVVYPGVKGWLKSLLLYIYGFLMAIFTRVCPACFWF